MTSSMLALPVHASRLMVCCILASWSLSKVDMKDTYAGCDAIAFNSDSNAPETPTANAIIPAAWRFMAAVTVAVISLDLPSVTTIATRGIP